MDLTAIQTALGTWLETVSGLKCYWREESQRWTGKARVISFLKVTQVVGVDETYYVYDDQAAQGQEITPHVRGPRQLLWEIQVESHSQKPGKDATHYLARIQSLLRSDSATDAFDTAEVGVATISDIRDLTFTSDKRRVSRGQIDVHLNAMADVADTPYGYVEQWEITGKLRDSAGNLLPADQQPTGVYGE